MNFYDIFHELNNTPRPSHHEEKVADYLCNFAKSLRLEYERDAENCVVIRKPASPGCENAEPIVLLNHMDMVAVSNGTRSFDPLNDSIEAYIEDGWMKARGTSLGADNGIGLSMALAVLADDSIQHGPLEVLTTTNEEDGMSGAANLSADFIRGRKVINLDSEDYDTITVGAAGAYLQVASFPIERKQTPDGLRFFKLEVKGGQGGHSGVDINKNRLNAIRLICQFIYTYKYIPNNSPLQAPPRGSEKAPCIQEELYLSEINGGSANASIPSECTAIVGVPEEEAQEFVEQFEWRKARNLRLCDVFEPDMQINIEEVETPETVIKDDHYISLVIENLPFGVLRMHDEIPGTVMTSNNIGVVCTKDDCITVSCHTRSFSDEEMVNVAESITNHFKVYGAEVEILMNTPGWQENQHSDFLHLVDETFNDTLGFYPRKVAMHFVLEAGYYVQKYPGIEIACIGPRIIEPHSTNERLEISTADNIWKVLVELLKRLS